ncbi:MAG: type II toxin-antitoxin system RelE/ParE family toxin [Methylacidiphilales bacterium]|nr:type II toxin-antitoxin system RelE/ParE family toxin [Candidatus Methylacidiphilales bacterium]
MEFTVEFYESETGKKPVLEFLEELKETNPDDHAAVMAGLNKLKNRQCHREPLSKDIGDNLYELRHIGKLNTRVLWFFTKGRRIILVHGIRNKAWKIPVSDKETALARMKDWMEREATR